MDTLDKQKPPNDPDAEFKAFRKTFLIQKSKQFYTKQTHDEIGKLISVINRMKNRYEKRIDNLNYKLYQSTINCTGYLKTERNVDVLRRSVQLLIHDSLFLELKTGLLYK